MMKLPVRRHSFIHPTNFPPRQSEVRLAFPWPAPTVRAMKFSWFLALRYLKPKRTFISIITVISVLGVALGVGVLIVVIAVMSGFEKRIKDEWLKVEPPIHLYDDSRSFFANGGSKGEAGDREWRDLRLKLKTFPGIQSASPFINVVTLAQTAPPKEFDSANVEVTPGSLPPDEPPPPEPEPEAPGPDKDKADPAPPKPTPEPAPAPEEAPAADAPAPKALSADEPEAAVTGLDRTRPLAPAIIIGVDTEDTAQMEKLERRFKELQGRFRSSGDLKIPSAWGEFDISGETMVLSAEVIKKLASGSDSGPIIAGQTRANLFGPSYINEGIDMIEEQRQAKDDKAKKAKIAKEDREYPLPMDLLVTGILDDDKQSGGPQGGIGYVSLNTAQKLAGAGKAVDGIQVELADAYDAGTVAEKLKASGILPPNWHVETWMERHRQQFEAVENERSMMYIVLGFISVVAAFCIMNTMITMAVQKRREIGMMRALGAKTSHIIALFMTNGFIVGLIGTGLGYGIGRLVLAYRNNLRDWINDTFGHQIFDAAIYGLNEIPAELRGMDEIYICGIAFVLCTLAAVPPAFLVGRMEPARALRNDR